MSIKENRMNVLCLIAHPDDAEIMAGGSIAAWIREGHKVNVLTFTDGVWRSPGGKLMRKRKDALQEEKNAAEYLGYSVENLQHPALSLEFCDKLVCEVLVRVEDLKIDTIICPWERDLHRDHEVVSRVAISASRRVGRVLMGQINNYLRDFFAPNIFVDITPTWEKKIESLKCFKSQWQRAGQETYEFLDAVTRYYGKLCGVKRAEGFITKKLLL